MEIFKIMALTSGVSIITTKFLMERYLKKLHLLDKEYLIQVQKIVDDSLQRWAKGKL